MNLMMQMKPSLVEVMYNMTHIWKAQNNNYYISKILNKTNQILFKNMKYHMNNEIKEDRDIFVFGSNEAGYHGKGAALHAKTYYGAQQYRGVGYYGDSYAIPTKDGKLRILPLKKIESYINQFCSFVERNQDKTFFITRIGCGLANYKDHEIAPLFKRIYNKPNVKWPIDWQEYIENSIP